MSTQIITNPHKPVLKYRSLQVIAPYEIFEVTNIDTGEVLWYEVSQMKAHKIVNEKIGRYPFPSEQLARDFIIKQISEAEPAPSERSAH